MQELIQNLSIGFSVLANPMVMLYTVLGVFFGVVIGALPGIGASAGVAVLVPLTFGMDPVVGIVLLAGIYYGAMYGSVITSILINVPGDSASVMTAVEGYQIALRGEAGKALGMAAYASVIGGTFAVIGFMIVAPFISRFALMFGPAEYFALMVLGLTSIAGLTNKSVAKGFLSAFIGLFIATIGLDLFHGSQRFAFGNIHLFSGIGFIPVAIGLFGVAEILSAKRDKEVVLDKDSIKLKKLLPTKTEWKLCGPHILRSTFLGFGIGLLPGAGATIASFLSYDMAKRTAKPERREEFGKGALEGVAAPEAASNSAAVGSMIPMLTLGVPGSGTTAVMLGALMMMGVTPGPRFFINEVEVAWGLIASMYLGNVVLLFLGVFGLPLFVQILKVKAPILNAVVLAFILIGTYALHNSMFTVGLTIFFGMIGYIFKKLDIPAPPLVLALVLGSLTESNLRQALLIGGGSMFAVVTRPITAVILIIAIFMCVAQPLSNLMRHLVKRRKTT